MSVVFVCALVLSTIWKEGDEFTIQLKQGRNVIRLIPSGGPDWDKSEWVNIYSLAVEENTDLTVIKNTSLTLAADASDYISHHTNKNDVAIDVWNVQY